MCNLSDKQTEILEYIKNYILSHGYPPSVRDICDGVNLKSPSSVHHHLSVLEEKGFINKSETSARSIEIIDPDFNLSNQEFASIPIVGDIAAGMPLLAEQNITDYYPLPLNFYNTSNNEYFMLKVKGDSMINAGIFDGDLVLIEKVEYANNGDIVAALIEDSATIKR